MLGAEAVANEAAERLLRSIPALADGRAYFSEAQRPQIIEYIKACIACSNCIPGTPEFIAARTNRNLLETGFDSTTMALTAATELEEANPIVFEPIKEKANESAQEAKIALVKEVFKAATDEQIRVNLPKLYTEAINLKKKIDAINKNLDFFFKEKSQLGAAAPDVKVTLLGCSTLNLEDAQFMIQLPEGDVATGYTVHNFLHISEMQATGRAVQSPYMGEAEFRLGHSQVMALCNYTVELTKWYNDFIVLFSAILGEDATPYVKTGQKPISEIVNAEAARASQRMPLLIAQNVTELQLRKLPGDKVVVLIGQVAIDLSNYPAPKMGEPPIDPEIALARRNALKAFLENMYAAHGLKDNKGHNKTFMTTPGFEYLSLLSIPNIETMFDALMAHAALESVARQMGFDSALAPEFIMTLDAENLSQAYVGLLQQKLMVQPISENSAAVIQKAGELFRPQVLHSVKDAKQAYDRSVGSMLNQLTGIVLKPLARQAYELSDAEKGALLVSPRPEQQAGAVIYTEADIDKLCAMLKGSKAYKEAKPSFENPKFLEGINFVRDASQFASRRDVAIHSLDECIDQLAIELKRRIRNPGIGQDQFFGTPPLNHALNCFVAFATQVYYQHKINVPQESIDRAFKKLGGLLTDEDLVGGCNGGLWGRMAEVVTTITSGSSDTLDEIITQLKRDVADDIFVRYINGEYGQSHAPAYKQSFYEEIGLSSALAPEERAAMFVGVMGNHLPRARARFFQELSKVFTPAAIYKKCFDTFMDNFRSFARGDDNERVYKQLKYLGYASDVEGDVTDADKIGLCKEYKINPTDPGSKWDISKIEWNLAEKLILRLRAKGFINHNYPRNLMLNNGAFSGRVGEFPAEAALPQAVAAPRAPQYPAAAAAAPPFAAGYRGGYGAAPQAVAAAPGAPQYPAAAAVAPPFAAGYRGDYGAAPQAAAYAVGRDPEIERYRQRAEARRAEVRAYRVAGLVPQAAQALYYQPAAAPPPPVGNLYYNPGPGQEPMLIPRGAPPAAAAAAAPPPRFAGAFAPPPAPGAAENVASVTGSNLAQNPACGSSG